MRISDPIKAYTNQSVNSPSGYLRSSDNMKINRTNDNALPKPSPVSDKSLEKASSSLKDPNKLITRQERDFFIKMFPENSEKLEKHVLFNRNGRLQTHNVQKGSIVDQKA